MSVDSGSERDLLDRHQMAESRLLFCLCFSLVGIAELVGWRIGGFLC